MEKAVTEVSSNYRPFDISIYHHLDLSMFSLQMMVSPNSFIILRCRSGAFSPFHLSTSNDWWKKLNLHAPIHLGRAVPLSVIERNTGTIICLTSRAAVRNYPYCSVVPIRNSYWSHNVSKAGRMEILNVECKDTNLRFFAIHPASALTPVDNISEVTTYTEHLEKSPAMKQTLTHFFPMSEG